MPLHPLQGVPPITFHRVLKTPAHAVRPGGPRAVRRTGRVHAARRACREGRGYPHPGPAGGVPARVYTPAGEGPFPLCVYFHGGGWVIGDLDSQDADCRAIANGAPCIVVSVNYRHAPEHKFPAAAEDAYRATLWVADNGEHLLGDGTRLAVCGMSAGANLAAVTALMARDRGRPHIKYQALIVPVTNYAFDTASYKENGEGYLLTRQSMQWFWALYLAIPAR